MKEIVDLLRKDNKTISTMESCTGGYIASSITDIENSSSVLKFSAVTYSNEYKIKMGVNPLTIDKYSVYSSEVAREMALSISKFTSSDYGIGITGKINRLDEANLYGKDNQIFYSIYDNNQDKYYDFSLITLPDARHNNKKYIVENIKQELYKILNK